VCSRIHVKMAVGLLVLLLSVTVPLGCGGDRSDGIPGEDNILADDQDTTKHEEPDSGIGEKYFASLGGWRHFDFKPGQYMRYNVTTLRGLEGWLSIEVDRDKDRNLELTMEGNWAGGDIAETATLKPDMKPFDFTYSLGFEAVNLTSPLFIISNLPLDEVKWEEGYQWEEGDRSLEISGEKTYAGVTGHVVTSQAPHSSTREIQNNEYVINPVFPLPLFVECPAANDTICYELAEASGF